MSPDTFVRRQSSYLSTWYTSSYRNYCDASVVLQMAVVSTSLEKYHWQLINVLYLVVSMIVAISIQRSDHNGTSLGPCIDRMWWVALLLRLWNVLSSKFSPFIYYTVCPTSYRTRHFFNNFTTDEDIATNFEADYRHIPLHFSHNERTAVQISLQYLHWC